MMSYLPAFAPKTWASSNKIPLNKECYICLQTFKKNNIIRQLPCDHMFCEGCLKPWLQKKSICPICKYELNPHKDEEEEDEDGGYDF